MNPVMSFQTRKTGERFAQASEEAHQYSDLEGVRLIEIFIKSRPREIEE